MGDNTQVNGKIIKWMDLENLLGQTEENIWGNIKKILKKELEVITGKLKELKT